MKIILTIKSILNYLYNNLIDLVWTKKIRFSDGTEMDTLPTSATLFDIKRRSIDDISDEKLVQKGWCCINESQPKRLAKANVPTAYNFLKEKLDGVDANIEGWQSKSFNNGIFSVIVDDNLLISYYGSGIYKCKIGEINDTSKWIQVNVTLNGTNAPDFSRANVIITDKVVCFTTVDGSLRYLIVLDRYTLEQVKSISLNFNSDVRFTSLVNNYIFIGINNTTYRIPNTNIADDIVLETVKSGLDIRLVFKFDGTYYYFIRWEGGYPRKWWVEKTTDFNNIISIGRLSGFGADAYKCMFTYDNNGNIYNFLQTNTIKKSKNIETWSGSGTEVWENTTLDFTNYGSAYTNASEIMFIFKNQTGFVIAYNLQDGGACIIYSTDLKNFQFIIKTSFSFSSYKQEYGDTNGDYANYGNGWTLYFSQPHAVPIVYTDTINGIDIKYYKSGDWKICTPNIAVGNDDNLQSVYEYLGYLNYWWIDTANEQITLQRDSAFETFMFVGDDYEDSTLPTGSYSPYATKQDVGNAGHTIIMKFTNNSGATLDTGESIGNSSIIFKNGNKLSIVDDYTINGTVITFLTALIPSDKIEVVFGNISSIDLSQFRQKAQTVEIDDASITIDNVSANTNYVFTSNAITDITLTACETSFEETSIQFTTGNSAPTLTDNSGLVWFSGIPTLQANTTYVIVIFNKQAFYQEN